MAGDDDLLSHAVAATEREIAASVFDNTAVPLDDTGDRSLEEMADDLDPIEEPETKVEAEAAKTADEAKTETEGDKDQPRDDKGKFVKAIEEPKKDTEPPAKEARTVPLGTLTDERQKRQAAEQERDALKADRDADRKAMADLNAKLDLMLRTQQQPPQPQQQQPQKTEEPPDVFTDPKGYAEYLKQGYQAELQARDQAIREMRGETSLQIARLRHGEVLDKALAAATALDRSNPDNQRQLAMFRDSPNPGEAVVSWHKQQEAIRRMGGDPDAYDAKVREETKTQLMADPEFRKQLLADMHAQASGANGGSPRNVVRPPGNMPKSLNSATGGGSANNADHDLYDNSERSVAEFALRR